MTRSGLVWIGTLLVAAAVGALFALNLEVAQMTLLILVLSIPIVLLARRLTLPEDSAWLMKLTLLAFASKMVASGLRYLMVTVLYGSGDSVGYHNTAIRMAESWRDLVVPTPGGGSAGTQFTDYVTSVLYIPYQPSMLGGFFIFATIAFAGQLLFYAAFRTASGPDRWRMYAILVFFVPTLLFWPSSIGKDSLMIFFIGMAAYAFARLTTKPRFGHLIMAAAGVGLAAAIRPHVAVLLVGSAVVALLLARGPVGSRSLTLRLGVLLVAIVGVIMTANLVTERFGIDTSGESVETFAEEVERRTDTGDSAVVGNAVQNPLDVPEAILRVLYRPLPYEAENAQALLTAIEATLLLGFTIWRLPAIARAFPRILRTPYMIFSLTYVIGFAIAFSPILNLGILARQRSQVIPLLLVLLVLPSSTTEQNGNKEPSRLGVGSTVNGSDRIQA